MVDLSDMKISHKDKMEPIQRFEVWFRTPMGLCTSIEKLNEVCKANDWLPYLMAVAVPVAISETLYEELVR